jgi:sporulation protein YlmC with PRC-barrel domain
MQTKGEIRMKKYSMLLSTLTMITLLLAACAGQTGTPGVEEPSTTTTVETTEEVTEEAPSGTETPGTGTETAQETTTPGIPVTGAEDASRVSVQIDLPVFNQDGEQVGDVDDLVLDFDNLTISYVVVGAGGFLGIGEKTVLVPWDSIELQTEASDMTGGEQNAFVLQTDQETFENSPDTDLDDVLPEIGEPAGDWDSDIVNFWTTGAVSTPSAGGTSTPSGTNATATPSSEMTATPGGTTDTMTGALQGVALASEVLGMEISLGEAGMQDQSQTTPEATPQATTTPGTDQGTQVVSDVFIDDLIADVETGEILFIVVVVDSTDAQLLIPVPLEHLQWDSNNQVLILVTDEETLQNAPSFEGGEYPDTSVDGWDSEFNDYWQGQ